MYDLSLSQLKYMLIIKKLSDSDYRMFDIAKRLEYSKASVRGMLRALQDNNLIYKDDNNNYYLTEQREATIEIYSTVCNKVKDKLIKNFNPLEESAKDTIICASSITQDALFKIAEKGVKKHDPIMVRKYR